MEEGDGGEGVEFDREEKQQSSRRAQLTRTGSVGFSVPSRETKKLTNHYNSPL